MKCKREIHDCVICDQNSKSHINDVLGSCQPKRGEKNKSFHGFEVCPKLKFTIFSEKRSQWETCLWEKLYLKKMKRKQIFWSWQKEYNLNAFNENFEEKNASFDEFHRILTKIMCFSETDKHHQVVWENLF